MVPGNFDLAPGKKYPMTFEPVFKGIRLWADTSFEDAANGIVSGGIQKLRIAILDDAGNVLEPAYHIAVGRAKGAGVWKRANIAFKFPAKTVSVNITREGVNDPGFAPEVISFDLY